MIRKDMLDNYNLQMPETMEDWYSVMSTLKNKNSNKAGFYPFISGKSELKRFSNAWGITNNFYLDGKTVKFGPYTPEWKEFLTEMAKWYKEGLVDPEYPLNDGKQLDAKITSGKAAAWQGPLSGSLGKYNQLMKAKDPNVKILGTVPPYLKGKKQYNFNANLILRNVGSGAAITAKSKYPKEAAMWLDYAYSDESTFLMNFGIEGESFNMVNGVPTLSDFITKNPQGLTVDQALYKFTPNANNSPSIMLPDLWMQRMWMPEQQDTISRWKVGSTEF
jgi:putative aldouronate transport system substrate-binding protein